MWRTSHCHWRSGCRNGDHSGQFGADWVNNTLNNLYWAIGNYIISEVKYDLYSDYGKSILATLSQTLISKKVVFLCVAISFFLKLIKVRKNKGQILTLVNN
ncbi:MAG TPA: DUF1016 domain-containing protein [Bacteroidales bacterium]|nr:DUF1016 domain-containing protein [Bacteroidales bacterium]